MEPRTAPSQGVVPHTALVMAPRDYVSGYGHAPRAEDPVDTVSPETEAERHFRPAAAIVGRRMAAGHSFQNHFHHALKKVAALTFWQFCAATLTSHTASRGV
jgi:hypothetical protein